ncbi:ABC transporter ATP-binding protein [Weissella minor]|nr:ABC transporter ATP-binding protein [Weissella minor]
MVNDKHIDLSLISAYNSLEINKKDDVFMRKKLLFGISNISILKLLVILIISTLAATGIQFVRGDLIESAVSFNTNSVIKYSVLYGSIMLVEVLFYYLEWQFENKLIRKVTYDLKNSVSNNILNRDKKIPESTVNNATQIINNSINSLEVPYYLSWFSSIYLVLRVLFVTTAIFYISYIAGFVIIGLMIIPLIATRLFQKNISDKKKRYLDKIGTNLSMFENIIQNFQYIQIFHISDFLRGQFQKSLAEERDLGIKSQKYQLTLNAIYSLISYTSSFMAIFIAALLIVNKSITIGMAITLLGLIDQLSLPVLNLSRNINAINSTKSIRQEIQQTIENNHPDKTKYTFNQTIMAHDLAINLDKKTLNYPDVEITNQHSYLIKGKSGIGKSIFLKTLLGLTEHGHGNVYFDHEKIDLSGNADVFDDIVYISASNTLFNLSVMENILFDQHPTSEQRVLMEKLLPQDILNARDSASLSSGEVRRVLLLRGLLSGKKTLIFDEPTANLDQTTSQHFWKLLFDWQQQSHGTIIVVSHTIDAKTESKFDTILNFNDLVITDTHSTHTHTA